ncbi:MAG: ArsR/SmtB family transcription factor [Candidatus Coproplasma sp.]
MEHVETVKILKALGDETRIKIFGMLRDGKLCACKILENLNITQPTLSHHMKIMCDSGIVVSERDWKRTFYSIDCGKLKELTAYLSDTVCCRKINH